jgi:hypothetical protein
MKCKSLIPEAHLVTLLLLCMSLLPACQPGYKQENGRWVWVSYDEAAGKRITEMELVDAESFKILTNKHYALDKNRVYFSSRVIKGADPNTFEILNDYGYSKDLYKVFLDWDQVLFADPHTFELLDFPYSKDHKAVYCMNIPLDLSVEDVNEFRVIQHDPHLRKSRTSLLKSYFIEQNPSYQWLDTLEIERIYTHERAMGQTKSRKFIGHQLLMN